jgi:outer membrane protein assembly factor BamD (BamD/ComL family)
MSPPSSNLGARRHGLGTALVLALSCSTAFPQSAPEDQARGLLEDGRSYLRAGKTKQALDNFNTIVTGFGQTDSVDDALLEIGRYEMEVEGDQDKARAAFEQVAKKYPQSDGAPGAYCQLGLLVLNRASTPAELEDALAYFNRVQRLYPGSDWVPRALHGAALVHRKAGRLADAVESGRRAALEYPSSEAAPEAHFLIGHVLSLLGEPRQAMEEFQQIRNRFPTSEWSPRALDRITALYRLYGGGKPTFTLDSSFNVGAGDVLKDVRGLLVTPDRTLWIGSEKVKAAVSFGATGKMGPSLGAAELRSLSLAPRGEVLVAARLAVRIGSKDLRSFQVPGDKQGVMEPLEKIEAAVVTPGGSLLVADSRRKRVYRFDAKYQFQGIFPDSKEREIVRMTVDGEGGIVLLDKDERTVRVYDEGGKLLRTVAAKGTGYELRRPSDAAVDPMRNLYVADEEGAVFVFSPQGQLLTTLSGGELRKPAAIALDPSGALLVYDGRAEKVLRYR